jgi:hypothetical protein
VFIRARSTRPAGTVGGRSKEYSFAVTVITVGWPCGAVVVVDALVGGVVGALPVALCPQATNGHRFTQAAQTGLLPAPERFGLGITRGRMHLDTTLSVLKAGLNKLTPYSL